MMFDSKFIYSEKATRFCKIFILLLFYVVPVKSKVKILQNVVAFSEYMYFNRSESATMYILIISIGIYYQITSLIFHSIFTQLFSKSHQSLRICFQRRLVKSMEQTHKLNIIVTIIISFIGISSIDDGLLVPDTGLFSQFEVILVVPLSVVDAVIIMKIIINMILVQIFIILDL